MAAIFLAAGLSAGAGASAQSTTRVIVSPDVEVQSISQSEIARIYLGKKTFWDSGARIEPSLLDEKSPLTESFLEENLKKTVRQFRAYWKRHLFSGQGTAPKTFTSSKLVADFVAANPGAIGIVDGSYADDRVKFVELTSE
jgi:ABC-type phosphate transport system substrate-binding protein